MPELDYPKLLADLQAEHDDLVAAMAGIGESDWDQPTPAPSWSVRDQISHLAFFDGVTVMALRDPDKFAAFRDEVMRDLSRYVETVGKRGQGKSGAEMIDWFATERGALVKALREVEPSTKVPWFGPSMAAASKATARIMETWAHGQDIVDGLGLDRSVTDRIEHVCHIGVRAFPNSYRANGRDVPEVAVRVELGGPSDQLWEWGKPGAENCVRGDALDFCLVVTQRRHPSDTRLEILGPVATEWMSIAQAFAGPPGEGRKPGQFS
ncbi:MAG TPA: TIGR03084 family metal-binding protein [Acidimicrobiales bacterium]|nr:TIGR03084 family metal-binding protein [Acidimicrobiales bacterium]